MKHLKQLRELKKHSSNKRLAAEEWNKPWQTLIATALSARTKDDTTIPVSNELFSKYNIVEKLAKAKIKDVEKIIRRVNYYKTKSRNIINCAKILSKRYNGKPPLDFNKLTELPGVGRKTANVFLSERGKDAIGVDTHIAYISQKLGWTKSSKPEIIEEDLKKLFPRKHWSSLNPIVVKFGQTHTNRKKKDELLNKIKNQ
ncbi:endonuclease III [Candidatus Woesearchaeota archaeon]|nr:endonuclease III [Candidatus Woesearchaeota archaeon]